MEAWRRSAGGGVLEARRRGDGGVEAGGAVPGQGREILVLSTPDATDGRR